MLREQAISIFKEEIKKYTQKVFYVGGCVRDSILGVESKDIDIEVFGVSPKTLESVLQVCSSKLGLKKVEMVGKQYGVYKLGSLVDISIPRTEKKIGLGHKDFEVEFDPYISTEKAQKRRDFTIGAIYQDVFTGEYIDHYHGLEDLRKGIIRAVDKDTFVEDALRVFRAAQFASRFGFEIDEQTVELCRSIDVSHLPIERILEETKKALEKSKEPTQYFKILMSVLGEEVFEKIFKVKSIEKWEKDWLTKYSKLELALDDKFNFLFSSMYFEVEETPLFLTVKQKKIVKLFKTLQEEDSIFKCFLVYLKDSELFKYAQYILPEHEKWIKIFEEAKSKCPSGEEVMEKYGLPPSKAVKEKMHEIYKSLLLKHTF